MLVLVAAGFLALAPLPQPPSPTAAPQPLLLAVDAGGEPIGLRLWPHSVRGRGFAVVAAAGRAAPVVVAPPAAHTYRGRVVEWPDAVVAASTGDAGVTALILRGDGRAFVVEPAAGRPVLRPAGGLPAGACGVGDAAGIRLGAAAGGPAATGAVVEAEIAFDCDVEFYQYRGSSVAAVVADIERTLDAVNLMYERDVAITHRITRIVVRTAEPDPYSGNDAGVILGTQFRGEWNGNQQGVPRDTAHFVTSRPMGNILGLAYVSVVCNLGSAYGLSRFGSSFDTNASVLGHELGHNWSCPHCLDTCDIMCGCGIAGGFGPNDRAQIAAFRASRSCLEPIYPEIAVHYRLDETAGSTARDAGFNGRDGVYAGGPTLGRPGARPGTGSAVAFDGIDDHVRIADGPGLTGLADGLTVASWVRLRRANGWARLFGDGTSWSFGLNGNLLVLSVFGQHDYAFNTTLLPDLWLHLSVAFDPRVGARLYVNGRDFGMLARQVDPLPTGAAWFIGSRDGASEFFAGELDDLQVYRGVLSAADVAYLFAHPGAPLCRPGAESYGAGLAGSTGIPGITVSGFAAIGGELRLHIDNSAGAPTFGFAALAARPASLPAFGGTLLVDLTSALFVPRLMAASGWDLDLAVPNDPALACRSLYAQAFAYDLGAVQGYSFTPGARLTFGSR